MIVVAKAKLEQSKLGGVLLLNNGRVCGASRVWTRVPCGTRDVGNISLRQPRGLEDGKIEKVKWNSCSLNPDVMVGLIGESQRSTWNILVGRRGQCHRESCCPAGLMYQVRY